MIRHKYSFVLFILIFLFALVPLLGLSEVFQVSEAREGFVVTEILQSGNWILPLRNGLFVPSKPLLFHWLSAVISFFFGSYDEFLLRLPSTLAAAATLLVLGIYVQQLSGKVAAALSVGLLASMYGFTRLAGDGRVDMLFTLFVVWAGLIALVHFSQQPTEKISGKVLRLFSLLCGLAALTKGPLGIVLPFAILLTFFLVVRGIKFWRELIRKEFILAFIIPLPWYLAAIFLGEASFVNRQLVFENLTRFIGGEGIDEKSSLFYLPHLVGQGAPWSIVFFLYLFFLARESFRQKNLKSNRFLPADSKSATAIVLSLIWFGIIILLLTLSAGKRRAYLLQALPSIAIVLALRIEGTITRLDREGRLPILLKGLKFETLSWGILIWLIGVLPAFLSVFLGANEGLILEGFISGSSRFFSAISAAQIRGGFTLAIIFFTLAGGSLTLWIYGHRKRDLIPLGFSLFLFLELLLVVYLQTWLSIKGHTHSYRRLASKVALFIPAEQNITLVKSEKDESFDGLFFYLKRHMRLLDPSNEPKTSGFYLARREWADRHKKYFYSEEILSGGRLVDKPSKELVLLKR